MDLDVRQAQSSGGFGTIVTMKDMANTNRINKELKISENGSFDNNGLKAMLANQKQQYEQDTINPSVASTINLYLQKANSSA